jgi:hypothetical protein
LGPGPFSRGLLNQPKGPKSRKEEGLCCGSFLRKGEVLACGRRIHNLKQLKEREFFIGNFLVRTHSIIEIILTGLAPLKFEYPFPSSLASTFLVLSLLLLSAVLQRRPMPPLPSPRPRGRHPAPDPSGPLGFFSGERERRDPAHFDEQPKRRKTQRTATLGRPQQESPPDLSKTISSPSSNHSFLENLKGGVPA